LNIEDFRGDFERVASLVQEAWADSVKRSLLYTAEFLTSVFDYPGAAFALAPTLYDGRTPIAFIAAFPRRIRYKGRERRIVVASFLSVAREFKKMGYGIVLWSELVRRAQAAGFDGIMNYCVEGEPMNGMILGSCRLSKIPVEQVRPISYLSCVIWPKDSAAVRGPADDSFVEDFLGLAAPIADRVPLARVWSRSEAEWQCSKRLGAVAVRHDGARGCGVLTGYIMSVADPKRTKCLLIEDILWGDLAREERAELVRRLKQEAAADGVRLAVVPVQGYGDTAPFLETGFRPSRRIVQAYFSLWAGPMDAGTLDAVYLDVF
jgi:GNAT superfamily N-acetyltransferase